MSRCIKSLGAVVSLQQILPEKTHKCFGRVKEKKPPPPRKRKCLVWRTLRLKSYCRMLRISNKCSTCKSDVLGRTTSNQVVINWCKGSSSSST
ncbi:uncharacterized protein G2W53_014940 [Senna tora]|uniref:Uncharacterized protein n=1 Tax=Senna tora TaxID=362788 RepID=A0A835C8Z0_9FABA|nr:uncharacterized protein G2W53_014940 [Senna tora]